MLEAFDLNFLWVFLVGILSFFSPCNFALIPTFIAYISGSSSTDGKIQDRKGVMTSSLLFVLGFMLVFLLIGAGVGAVSQFLNFNRDILRIIAGVFIILIGLIFLLHLNVKLFKRDYYFELPKVFVKHKKIKSFVTGTALAFGWSPCYGPLIGAILTLVLSTGSTVSGILYFFVYSLGFVIPFLFLAFFINVCMGYMNRVKKFLKYFHVISGLLLILIGFIMIADQTLILTGWLYNLYDAFGIPYIS